MGEQTPHRVTIASGFLLTGTWGTGKTTLLEQLDGLFEIVPEHGRLLAREGLAPSEFCSQMLTLSLADHVAASQRDEVALFDRGIPDTWAYARHFGVGEEPYRQAATAKRYRARAFFFPFWPEIYVNDALRRATPEQAQGFDALLRRTYEEAGYELIEVPRADVGVRMRFLKEEIDGTN